MKFEFKQLDETYIDRVMKLQEDTFEWLEDKSVLRKNTREIFSNCLKAPNYALGAFYEEDFAGVAILEFPKEEDDLSLLSDMDLAEKKSAIFKLVIVNKKYLGHGLQRQLVEKVDRKAKEKGIDILFSTISPKNTYSLDNAEKSGYKTEKIIPKYGSERCLMYKYL